MRLRTGPASAPGSPSKTAFSRSGSPATLARVHAAGNVNLSALTTTDILSVVEAGSAGNDVSADGAFSLVLLGYESLAFIEDRATVEAGLDVILDADSDTVVVNLAGGIARGEDVGVGAAGAFTVIREAGSLDEGGEFAEELDGFAKTHAFIGDSLEDVPAVGTGGVRGSGSRSSAATASQISNAHARARSAAGPSSSARQGLGRADRIVTRRGVEVRHR